MLRTEYKPQLLPRYFAASSRILGSEDLCRTQTQVQPWMLSPLQFDQEVDRSLQKFWSHQDSSGPHFRLLNSCSSAASCISRVGENDSVLAEPQNCCNSLISVLSCILPRLISLRSMSLQASSTTAAHLAALHMLWHACQRRLYHWHYTRCA